MAIHVGLRISRVNHSCVPNADHVYDETNNVEILYALRDIQEGEEICYRYGYFSTFTEPSDSPNQSLEDELHDRSLVLIGQWGIKCPDDCFCKAASTLDMLSFGRKVMVELQALVQTGVTEVVLTVGADLLKRIYHRLYSSWIDRASTHCFLFQTAIRSSKTMPKAGQHIRSAVEICRAVCPFSERTKEYENMMKHPEMDPNYLMIDKRPLPFLEDLNLL